MNNALSRIAMLGKFADSIGGFDPPRSAPVYY